MGVELEDHLESERLQKEREAASKAAADRSRRMLEADDLDTDSESESEGTPDDGIIIARRPDTRTNANAYAGENENTQQMSFDIFVKGQQTRQRGAGTGGVDGGVTARFRMFPFITRMGRKVDDYGEGLDIGQWVRKGREIEEEGETEEVREAKRRKLEEDEKKVSEAIVKLARGIRADVGRKHLQNRHRSMLPICSVSTCALPSSSLIWRDYMMDKL